MVEAFSLQGPRGQVHVANLAISDDGLGVQSSVLFPLTVVRLLQCRLKSNVRLGPQIVLARLAAWKICAHVATRIARPESPDAKRNSDEQSRRTEMVHGVVLEPEVFDGTESRAAIVDLSASFACMRQQASVGQGLRVNTRVVSTGARDVFISVETFLAANAFVHEVMIDVERCEHIVWCSHDGYGVCWLLETRDETTSNRSSLAHS